MKRVMLCAFILAFALAAKQQPSSLPVLGTKFHPLPAGKGKALVEASCYPCHSADMLVQQRLTEKQWTATVEKMIRWGAAVKDNDKAAVIAYLAKNFGVENKFTPIRTRVVGK